MSSKTVNYTELLKSANAYLNQQKAAGTHRSPEGEGAPAQNIPDPTKKETPEGAHSPQPDAKPAKQNLPDGENTKTKAQPESASASGVLEGNRGNAPTDSKKEPPVESDNVMTVNKREGGDTAKAASEILGLLAKITGDTVKKADEAPKADAKKDEAPKADAKKDEAPAAEAPKADGKKDAPAAAPEKKEAGDKVPELDEMTRDLYAKIACIVLDTEAGRALVEKTLKKAAGAQAAMEFLAFEDTMAKQAALEQEKRAAYEQGQLACDAVIAELQQKAAQAQQQPDMWKIAALKERIKAAIPESVKEAAAAKQNEAVAFHAPIMAQFATESEKRAYAMGAGLMGSMADAGGAAPEMEAGGEGGEGEVTMEDVVAALEMLVQEGTITEEDAQAILAQISDGGGAAPGAEAAPEAAAGKEASAKTPVQLAQEAGVKAAAELAAAKAKK